ncbi:NAD-glutamate dehydrogenase [Kocuria marina]|uniref:Glutamate dehydrogenase (NAD) n=1 Tax=Kocuria marina subsp. indica TaxID=1049583 RepID=A0A1X7CR94_9MICC|nr:NAD-glutamate dehydrogenase [Kocuria indica]OXS84096.1 glutamate dehydrogenase [Kocuria indica]RLP58392.1 NAD-glutamate dehydrogenase [Kocuria indica]SMF00968.1 glutamate dehydrogenase (NAD) [Kocuria indica]
MTSPQATTQAIPTVWQRPRWSAEQAWLNEYYRSVPDADMAGTDQQVLTERAESHREVGRSRRTDELCIEVREDHGDTVLYMVTTDMPFLVSTLTTEIAANWGGAKLVLHPLLLAARDSEDVLRSLGEVPNISAVSSGDTTSIPITDELVGGAAGGRSHTAVESWIRVELHRTLDEQARGELARHIEALVADVRRVAEDQEAMLEQARRIADSLAPLEDITFEDGSRLPDVGASQEFLEWLRGGNFVFMGIKRYDLEVDGEDAVLHSRPDTGLGLLREQGTQGHAQKLTGLGSAHARDHQVVFVTKANRRSSIHRREYLDYIGVRTFAENGDVDGEYLILGLFSRHAYSVPAQQTPLVREKVQRVVERFGFLPDSHSARDLMGIIEDYPRDELFHMSAEELHETAGGVLGLNERRQTRVFLRQDTFGRFMSAVVFLPRDRYNTSVRQRIETQLFEVFDAEAIDFEVRLTSSSLARLFFRIRLPYTGEVRDFDHEDLEARLRAAVRSWPESLGRAIGLEFEDDKAGALGPVWENAFPGSYREDYEIEEAIQDLKRCEELWGRDPDLPAEVRVAQTADGQVRLNIYLTQALSLTELLPLLHNMGLTVLDQRPYTVTPADGREFQLYDFGVELPEGVDPQGPEDAKTEDLIEHTLCAVLSNRSESDSLDRLVLTERMGWRTVAVLRAYVRYLLQLNYPNSFEFIADTLVDYPRATHELAELFSASFDPSRFTDDDAARDEARNGALERLAGVLDEVPSLNADRLFRALADVVTATLRTNVFQSRPTMAFKLDPEAIPAAPQPRPAFEIWVWSPRVEGTHLRFGQVARGGLRWSDRREDFRTEVLGLVKAQMVKNAVIVPTGAKGGFFPKQLPDPATDREGWLTEGREAYKLFIASLLDVTDNIEREAETGTAQDGTARDTASSSRGDSTPGSEGGASESAETSGVAGDTVVHPENVVRRDDDDSYLVVAADKGTAAFSDTANAISLERGFWLGDAFASGGSVGYDHKAMGITARGAWESVKRHFFELGVDTQSEAFTVVGVGDMSGDVFGNGMLLSEHIHLIAAFDHRDIFLDPTPNAAASYQERERLFTAGRTSWQDFDRDVISEGGGVYSRRDKSVPITPQVREALGIEDDVESLSPQELVRRVLLAPADLLYNGGIGTYVKASTETNQEVGDKANDAIRVNGEDLRVKVIGEGGNLGATQLGRTEAALNGILVNTDAIDNSGGVESSDREVNIKILVDGMVQAGLLSTDERAEFIESMTDEVAELVLRTNVAQNVLLTTERARGVEFTETFIRLMHWLEEHADLNRELEFLPSDSELRERAAQGQPLTGPELSVLTAYAKIQLSAALVDSDLADDPWFHRTLSQYFPAQIRERFDDKLDTHPLRREIIATVVANQIINYGGIAFAYRVVDDSGSDLVDVARAFTVAMEIFELESYATRHAQLDADVPLELWNRMSLRMRRLLDRVVRWFLHRQDTDSGIQELVEMYRPIVALRFGNDRLLGEESAERARTEAELAERQGVPRALAVEWAELLDAFALLDVARLAQAQGIAGYEPGDAAASSDDTAQGSGEGVTVQMIARVYFALFDRYGLENLLNRITALPQTTRWENMARIAMREDLYSTLVALAGQALDSPGNNAQEKVQAWEQENADRLERLREVLDEIESMADSGDAGAELAALSVALRTLRSALTD